MRMQVVMVLLVFVSMSVASADQLSDAQATFKTKHDELLKSGNGTEYVKLFYTNGESAFQQDRHRQLGATIAYEHGLMSEMKDYKSEFLPLPPGYGTVTIGHGKKEEPNITPIALLHITYSSGQVMKVDVERAVGMVDGKMYLVGKKQTDLGWKGPEDSDFRVNVSPKGSHAYPQFSATYVCNVSGVDVKGVFPGSGFTVRGQFIKEVNVKNLATNQVLELKIMKHQPFGNDTVAIVESEGPGKDISYVMKPDAGMAREVSGKRDDAVKPATRPADAAAVPKASQPMKDASKKFIVIGHLSAPSADAPAAVVAMIEAEGGSVGHGTYKITCTNEVLVTAIKGAITQAALVLVSGELKPDGATLEASECQLPKFTPRPRHP